MFHVKQLNLNFTFSDNKRIITHIRKGACALGQIIGIVNQKGGVGKTTTAVNLTAALHRLGKKVLLCDFDPQANATSGLGVEKDKTPASSYDVIINGRPAAEAIGHTPHGDVIPSSANLCGAGVELIAIPDREFTFIAGSSMGGLMTLYAVTAYNHVFSRGAALSPSLWTSPWKIELFIRKSRIAPDTVLYMDYGSEELGWRSMEKTFGRISARLLEKKVNLTSRIVPGGNHSEGSWERQIPFFMDILFYGLD